MLYLPCNRGAIASPPNHCWQSPGNILLSSWWNICLRSLAVLLWQLNSVITQDCVRVAGVIEIVLFHFMSLGFLWGFLFFSRFPFFSLGKGICFLCRFLLLYSGNVKTNFKRKENNVPHLVFLFSTRTTAKQPQTVSGLAFPRSTFYFIVPFTLAVVWEFLWCHRNWNLLSWTDSFSHSWNSLSKRAVFLTGNVACVQVFVGPTCLWPYADKWDFSIFIEYNI